MNIKEYKFNKVNIDNLECIMEIADHAHEELDNYTEDGVEFSQELYELYQNYLFSINVHMLAYRDVMKLIYDKVDLVKDIFKKDETLYKKIMVSLNNVEKVFETYDYMCSRLEEKKEEYQEEFKKFMIRNVTLDIEAEERMKDKWESVCGLHYELIGQMNAFIDMVAQPQIDILDTIYSVELDFNKALNLKETNCLEK